MAYGAVASMPDKKIQVLFCPGLLRCKTPISCFVGTLANTRVPLNPQPVCSRKGEGEPFGPSPDQPPSGPTGMKFDPVSIKISVFKKMALAKKNEQFL
jgi:hypothetical protein